MLGRNRAGRTAIVGVYAQETLAMLNVLQLFWLVPGAGIILGTGLDLCW